MTKKKEVKLLEKHCFSCKHKIVRDEIKGLNNKSFQWCTKHKHSINLFDSCGYWENENL